MPESGFLAQAWWIPVLYILVTGHMTNVAVTLYLHRAMTHRGLELHPLASIPLRFWLWLTTAMVTKEWVACHRKHHGHSDREGDPHSPVLEGLKEIVFAGVVYYIRAVREPGMVEKYGKGTPDDWLERNIFSRYVWVGILITLALDLFLFGAAVGSIVWAVQMAWIPFWAAGVVNGFGHAVGYRNFNLKDASRNILPVGFFLAGEELHNNHHADPRSAKFSARRFEFDIGWIYIKILAALGLAKIKYARE